MTETHFYEPRHGHRLAHDPLKAIVAPRPIGWISSISPDGHVNLAPYSFFNMICDSPPMLMFCSAGWKDSVRNISETREFVANLATRPLAEAMNQTSAGLAYGVNEMDFAHLAASPSRLVRPPRVTDSPTALECRCVEVREVPALDGAATDTWMVIGEIVGVHIGAAFIVENQFSTVAAQTIARCGYRGDYAEVTEVFEMVRPKAG